MALLSHDEQVRVLEDFIDAYKEGKKEEAAKIIRRLPLPAPVAMVAKEVLGTQGLLNLEYDLSDAEGVYGKNWLSQ